MAERAKVLEILEEIERMPEEDKRRVKAELDKKLGLDIGMQSQEDRSFKQLDAEEGLDTVLEDTTRAEEDRAETAQRFDEVFKSQE